MALWKEIPGYEGLYLVSSDGEVYSMPKCVNVGKYVHLRKGRTLKPGLRGKGDLLYKFVVLKDKFGNSKHESVHRLVAKAFLPNENNYPEVNHIDKNPLNNCVDNLEWCTKKYNIGYSKNIKVAQYTMDGEKIAVYKSISIAAETTGISRTAINNVLTGWSKSSGGYKWEYEKEE